MYKVNIISKSGYTFTIGGDGFEFNIEAKEEGASPSDIFLASLGSCVGVYVRKYLNGAKVQSDKFSVEVESDLSKDRPISFREIKISIRLDGVEINEQRKKSLLRFIKNCPIHNTLNLAPAISCEIL